MGYYTRFDGGVSGPPELLAEFEAAAERDETFGQYGLELSEWLDGQFFGGDTAKWYGYKDDVTDLSKKFPGLLFWISGEGEESGDIWKAWARNGRFKMVQARIVFDEPDIEKELPSPDVEAMLEEVRQRKRAELDAEIARLQSERAAL
jgi:hypothetical protein